MSTWMLYRRADGSLRMTHRCARTGRTHDATGDVGDASGPAAALDRLFADDRVRPGDVITLPDGTVLQVALGTASA